MQRKGSIKCSKDVYVFNKKKVYDENHCQWFFSIKNSILCMQKKSVDL